MTCLMSLPDGLLFSDLKEQCGLSDGNLNRHLEVLNESGCLKIEKLGAGRGSKTNYRLSPSGRRLFDNYLEELERVLAIAQQAAIQNDKASKAVSRIRTEFA
jgi:predicted ArsR family transcriptional regulator